MKTFVVSLGGSVIVPDKVDYDFIKRFKNLIGKLSKKNRFVIVVGGGSTARKYIRPLQKEGVDEKICCLIGIGVTRLNARFMANFFGRKISSQSIPSSLKEVNNLLMKNNVVFAGGLRFEPDNTSDGTAASVANYLKADFANMTNVKGLYTKDPRKFKDAKFVKEISFDEFYKITKKIKYEAGQHFVLDQHAAKIIREHKIKTVIVGEDLRNFENYLKGKRFVGTVIS